MITNRTPDRISGLREAIGATKAQALTSKERARAQQADRDLLARTLAAQAEANSRIGGPVISERDAVALWNISDLDPEVQERLLYVREHEGLIAYATQLGLARIDAAEARKAAEAIAGATS